MNKYDFKIYDALLFTKADDLVEEGIEFITNEDGFHIATVKEVFDNYVLAWSANAGKGVHIAKYTNSQMIKDKVLVAEPPRKLTKGEKQNAFNKFEYYVKNKTGYDYLACLDFLDKFLPEFMRKWLHGSKNKLMCSEYFTTVFSYIGLLKLIKRSDKYSPRQAFDLFKFKFEVK